MTARATEDFMRQLQQRLALTDDAAVSTLADWLSSYEPGPLAREKSSSLPGRSSDSRAVAVSVG